MLQQQAKTAGEQLPGGARDRSIRAARVIVCGATDLSPVCMGAALHFDTWVPNFGVQEYMRHTELTDEVFPHGYRFDQGFMHCSETPGRGLESDEPRAAKSPSQRPSLPVNRLAHDGTLWNW